MTQQLISGGTQQSGDTAKRLVHEWAHYRFGVFSEFGYPSDPIYPPFYTIAGNPESDEILINSCTDDQKTINYHTYDEDNGKDCRPIANNMTGRPINDKCFPVPDLQNSFKSSLMYSHSGENITHFCGSAPGDEYHRHNVDSPNKQNTLCDGKDVWTVISAHKDING